MTWLNEDLKEKIKNHFEPKYGRKLSSDEVVTIANNLTSFVEIYSKFKWRLIDENKHAR